MSSLSAGVLSTLKNNFLWSGALAQTPGLEPEARKTIGDRIKKTADSLSFVENGGFGSVAKVLGETLPADSAGGSRSGGLIKVSATTQKFQKASQAASGLAIEQCTGCCAQIAKLSLFGNPNSFAKGLAKGEKQRGQQQKVATSLSHAVAGL